MSSGFVSAGTNEQPIERDDEWLRAEQELEEERRRKAELGKQEGGKSLFEILERNKMAKQEAFEEKSRLRNQFRSLDEDEVEFLDSVLESTRAQEAAVKKETADQLEAFRRQREEAEKALLESASSDAPGQGKGQGEDWIALARKRRRDKQRDLLIPGKKRKASATENAAGKDTHNGKDSQKQDDAGSLSTKKLDQGTSKSDEAAAAASATASQTTNPATQAEVVTDTDKPQVKTKSPTKSPAVSLGLGGYSSDSE
ncbi:uncharacterized protein N7500_008584 [Penicillium coprophilum]|uniref:uncharacterized protein n=1 Tax=Penicillium coprophilum TaxID=36646 RepID=UPI00238B407B|nr:uncharacterized protein N7500_008584 [Penicillium coprophilum]KAJ5158933.1 hypothetical protein N7500_008584 [Penicillium coprophilum]